MGVLELAKASFEGEHPGQKLEDQPTPVRRQWEAAAVQAMLLIKYQLPKGSPEAMAIDQSLRAWPR